MIGLFGLVGFLWHIKHCKLFNAKSSLYIFIKYIGFGLVGVLWHINHCWLFNTKYSLYMYIRDIGFGFVGFLWHINHCRLFNAKSSLYIFIKYIGFGWVGFYGISTIVGYSIPNTLHTCILDIWYGLVGFLWYINHWRLFNAKSSLYMYVKYDLSTHFVDIIFKEAWTNFKC